MTEEIKKTVECPGCECQVNLIITKNGKTIAVEVETYKSVPKCCECPKKSMPGAKVCKEHSWCYRCDDEGRESQKMPEDMVPQKNTPPICRDCAKC